NYPADAATDAMARFMLRRQFADGGWRIGTQRPPIESSDVEATAIGLRSLQSYAPEPQQAEYAKAVERGAAWLAQAEPQSNEDHNSQLLGLVWARAKKDVIQKSARNLIALQRADGGWAQIASLASDAYATGQALTALAESGAIAVTDSVYR